MDRWQAIVGKPLREVACCFLILPAIYARTFVLRLAGQIYHTRMSSITISNIQKSRPSRV